MSFGGSQGTIRYAVMLQDQVTVPAQKISNEFRNMGTQMTTLTQKANVFNNSIMSNTRAFSASVTPIKNTGNALNQLGIQQKTVGSQLASIGSGFKNNALAIGSAASAVLGLYQNYANLSSAQNAANKSATAAKAAQNNLTKAQDGLNKAIDKYGAGSKEAKDAQNKLTVAQERAVNKTESAKIAQDNLNQTMADFGINILPNVVLAGGSFTDVISKITAKSADGVGGLTKLKGGIAGIGTAITGTAIPALTSFITGGNGLTGLMDKLKGATTSATGFWGSVAGTGIAGGLVLGGAALIIQQVQQIQDAFDAAGIKFAKMKQGMLFSPKEAQLGFEELDELMKRTGMSIIEITNDMEGAKKKFVEAGGTLDQYGNIVFDADKKQKELVKSTDAVTKSLNNVKTVAPTVSKLQNAIVASFLTGAPAANDYSNMLIELNKQIFENTTLSGQQAKAVANVPKAFNVAAGATAGTIKNLGANANITGDQINQFQINADNAAKAVEALKKATQDAASGFSDFGKAAQDILGKGFEKLNMKKAFDRVQKEADTFQANFIKAMDKGGFEGAKAFALKFSETPQKFIKPKDVMAFDSLIKWINANAGLPAEAFAKQLAIKWEQLAPETRTAFGKLMAGLPEEATTIGTDTGTAMGTATVAAFRKATDKKLFPQKGTMLGPLVGDKGGFPKTPIIPKGPTTPAITTQKTVITVDNSQAIKAVDVVAKRITSLSGIKAIISLINQAAIKAIDVVAKRIDSLTKIKPDISLQNKTAIKAVDAVAKRIDSLTKIKPSISLNNKQAIKAVDVVAKRISDLSNINPTVHVGISGPGVKFAQHGMHETLAHDQLIMAHSGERVDIGEGSRRAGSSTGSGSGGGDLIVNNVIDIGTERIVRTVKRKLGQGFYAFGA